MTQFYLEAAGQKFDPTWIEFHKPIFLGGYGYVGSVGLASHVSDRPDRPTCAGASKTPDGWLVWMSSGAAALIPETNIKYVGAVRVTEVPAEMPEPAANRFSHLPDEVRAKVMAQAEGGFAGDGGGLAGLARPQNATRVICASQKDELARALGMVAEAGAEQPTSATVEPAKKRRGRPPKVRPEMVEPSAP